MMMTIIGIILCSPLVIIMLLRLVIGMFDRDDPDQAVWIFLFFTLCAIVGALMIICSQLFEI